MKFQVFTLVFGLFTMSALPSLANEVSVKSDRLVVSISERNDAYALFEQLIVRAERADQGELKRFEARSSQDSLDLYCSFDHRTVCEFSYATRDRNYLNQIDGKSGILFASPEVSMALYNALVGPAVQGYGQSRKHYITADAALEISCTQRAGVNDQARCMFVVIKSN